MDSQHQRGQLVHHKGSARRGETPVETRDHGSAEVCRLPSLILEESPASNREVCKLRDREEGEHHREYSFYWKYYNLSNNFNSEARYFRTQFICTALAAYDEKRTNRCQSNATVTYFHLSQVGKYNFKLKI